MKKVAFNLLVVWGVCFVLIGHCFAENNEAMNNKRRIAVLVLETLSEEEISEIMVLKVEDREKFKMSLVSIKEKGLAELEPISGTAQKIKAHMLITLNKANIQKAILLAKTKLAGNAHLQLKTLNIIKKETVNINCELEDLLRELDTLNNNAIDSFSSFKTDISKTVKNNESVNAISSILTKIQSTPAQLKKQREVDKKKTKLETKDLW